MLVMTLNFCVSFQTNGSRIRPGGYMSQSRVCWGAFPDVGLGFDCERFREAEVMNCGQPYLAARDRWDDADFVAILQRSLLVLQKADIFLVDVNVDETAHIAFVVHQAFPDSRKAGLELGDGFADGGSRDLNHLFVVGKLAQWTGDSNFLWHNQM